MPFEPERWRAQRAVVMSVLTFLGREERLHAADSPSGAVSGDQGASTGADVVCREV